MFFETIKQYLVLLALSVRRFLSREINPEMQDFEIYRLEGCKGNIESQYKVGHILIDRNFNDYYHNFQNKQEVEAVKWLKRAADNGHSEARYELGEIYSSGIGQIYQDAIVAFEWYEKAAHQNHAEAQYELSLMYNEGRGTRKDSEQSDEWFEKSRDNAMKEIEKNNAQIEFITGLQEKLQSVMTKK